MYGSSQPATWNPPRWSTTTISTASMRTSGHSSYEGQNAGPLGRLGSGEDDFGQAWDSVSARDAESVAKVVPERDFELGAGFGETEKGIAAITTDIAAGAGTDLA